MKGGYFMAEVNADLSNNNDQTISGIYDIAKKAVESGKSIIIYGMHYDGKKTSPINVYGWFDNEMYIFFSGVLQINIDKKDRLRVILNMDVEPRHINN